MDSGNLKNLVLIQEPQAGTNIERTSRLDELLEQLQSDRVVDRVLAAEALAAFGPDAVEPLCGVLTSEDDELRIAAARSLGVIGDARAVSPLISVLRSKCTGGTGAKHRRRGRIFVLTMLLILFVPPFLAALFSEKPGGAFFIAMIGPLTAWAAQRQPRGRVFRAVSRALAQIAEAEPTPEVREVLPELDALATDAIQQDGETRAALREASVRIDSLTTNLRSLPLAAAAPEPDVMQIPIAAVGSEANPAVLPRVSGLDG